MRVITTHDIYGRKQIIVKTQLDDDFREQTYVMFQSVGNPLNDLWLATVEPGDQVAVTDVMSGACFTSDYTPVDGKYTSIITPSYGRPNVCSCGTPLLGSGDGVYCTNTYCPLTMAARISKLSCCELVPRDFINIEEPPLRFQSGSSEAAYWTRVAHLRRPFHRLTTPAFWGRSGDHHVDIAEVITRIGSQVNLATFFCEYLAQTFCDHYGSNINPVFVNAAYGEIGQYLSLVKDYSFRQTDRTPADCEMMMSLLDSLSIRFLGLDIIQRLVDYERRNFYGLDRFCTYADILTSEKSLIEVCGAHPITARSILRSIKMRQNEIFSIFAEFGEVDYIATSFDRLNRVNAYAIG
jgi:hypothetical protein